METFFQYLWSELQSESEFEKSFPDYAKGHILNFFKMMSLIATAKNDTGEEVDLISEEGTIHPNLLELAATLEANIVSNMRFPY